MSHPLRIQCKRAKGWRRPYGTIYVGRPTKWANPFDWQYWVRYFGMTPAAARSKVVAQFSDCVCGIDEAYDPEKQDKIDWIREHIDELRGKTLVCWCPLDQACHADVLAEIANKKE